MKDNEFYFCKSEYDSSSKKTEAQVSQAQLRLKKHSRRRKLLNLLCTATMIVVIAFSTGSGGKNLGYIRDAKTGDGLASVSLEFRRGENVTTGAVVSKTTTDGEGRFYVSLPNGVYTAHASKDGYVPEEINFVINEEEQGNLIGTMLPLLSGNAYTIVLTWGETPYDLDSHVELNDNLGQFMHVFFGQSSYEKDGKILCYLDVDDTTSYGPETITLDSFTTEPYYYYIHNFSGDDYLFGSKANVKLYQGSRLLKTFDIPDGVSSGIYWNVFAIKNNKIIVKNTITEYPDIDYAKN